MSEQQRLTLERLLRESPLDLAGELTAQRAIFEQMSAAQPIPDDVRAVPSTLGGVPVVVLDGVEPAVVLFIHGGAFAIGSARASVPLVADVAKRANARAVTVDYRLAPENPFPAALEDVLAVYHALSLATDPARITVVGESAGGGLVMATLVALRDRGLPMPACAAVFSPWVDLTLSGASIMTKAGVDPVLTGRGLRSRAVDYLGTSGVDAVTASPLFAQYTGLPPLLIQVGSHEILLDDATRLASRAAQFDVAVELQVSPGMPHVFQAFAASLDEGGHALDRAASFLRRNLGTDGRSRSPELRSPR